MSRIAVDAMGGDRAPEEIVRGALDAAQVGIDVVLVGEESRIRPLLPAGSIGDVAVVHASEVIEMGDDPAAALREKKDASVSVAAKLVAGGEAQGMVSAGSTGAAIAAAAFIIGRLPGVSRPGLATLMPGDKVVLDSGANVNCRADQLAQFAVMGAALAASHLHIDDPKVGLLNIGEESGKGRDLDREAQQVLSQMPGINYIGNVEGHDIATQRADVIVADGFTGNVFLKTAEGAAHMVQRMLLDAVSRPEYQEALAALAPALADFRIRLDPETTGGAHLLGVKGMVVIAHGSSSRVAVKNAIEMAAEGADDDLPGKIATGLTIGARV